MDQFPVRKVEQKDCFETILMQKVGRFPKSEHEAGISMLGQAVSENDYKGFDVLQLLADTG